MHDDRLDPSCKNLAESFSGEGGHSILRRDDTLQAEVWLALWQAEDLQALDTSSMDVIIRDGEVWLSGQVEDIHKIHLAECLVNGIEGVCCCHNLLMMKKAASSD